MFISFIRYIRGYVKIRVIGYSPERFLNACRHRGIYLWGLKSQNGVYEMYMSIKGFRKLKPVIKKTRTRVVIEERFGLPFFLHKYRRRKLFFAGAALCIFLVYAMSLFIWNIDITGNISRTDETLLTFLETKQVSHGMQKSNVDCASIVKEIRKEFNDIIWVSASIKGTRLIIQIKENEDSQEEHTLQEAETNTEEAVDLIASQDCVITEIITRKGTPAVKAGDAVKKGDVLVSGRIEVKNDAQEITGYRYVAADADIRCQAVLPYESLHSLTYTEKTYYDIQKEQLYIRFGTYFIGLGTIENTYEHFDLTTHEKTLTIGRHFELPIAYGVRMVQPYKPKELPYKKETLQKILTDRFTKDCEEMQKKGLEIIGNDVKIYTEQHFAKAKGTLTVITDIGEQTPATRLSEAGAATEEGNETDGND